MFAKAQFHPILGGGFLGLLLKGRRSFGSKKKQKKKKNTSLLASVTTSQL
jgi:hypothetical protein